MSPRPSLTDCLAIRSPRRALTLAELLVVLVILAILTTVAVQSMGPVVQQSRIDAAKKTLVNLRAAIIGISVNGSDPAAVGYVADHGTMPAQLTDLERYLLPQISNQSYFVDRAGNILFDFQQVSPGTWRIQALEPSLLDANGQPLLFVDVLTTDWRAQSLRGTLFCSSPGSGQYKIELISNNPSVDPTAQIMSIPTGSEQVSFEFLDSDTTPLPIGPRTLRVTVGGTTTPIDVHLTLHALENRTIQVTVPATTATIPATTP